MMIRRSRHGLRRVMAAVRLHGLDGIDRRTAAAQALLRWRAELLRDLGGAESISAQRMALVELATRTRLFIEHTNSWLMQQGSIINKRRRALLPIVMQRQTLCDSLARLLGQLGLDRRAKPIPSLSEYLVKKQLAAQDRSVEQASRDKPPAQPNEMGEAMERD